MGTNSKMGKSEIFCSNFEMGKFTKLEPILCRDISLFVYRCLIIFFFYDVFSDHVMSSVLFLAPLAIGQRAYVIVCCLSCMRASVHPCVNFFFKHLLRNYLSDFDEIPQKCSYHGPLQNFLK